MSESWQGKIFSGSWVDGRGEPLDVTEKATGTLLGTVGSATADDLDPAVDSARNAQREWSAQGKAGFELMLVVSERCRLTRCRSAG